MTDKELRRLEKKATPGPWADVRLGNVVTKQVVSPQGYVQNLCIFNIYDEKFLCALRNEALPIIDQLQDRITALIAAGDELSRFAECDPDICFSSHGKPCTCGYDKALEEWQKVSGHE
jgi:hypothetical protein